VWRRLRVTVAAALALAGCLGVLALLAAGGNDESGSPSSPTAGSPFFGIVAEDAFGRGLDYRERQLGRIAATGVGLVRQSVDWARVERSPGYYHFGFYDRWVADLARHGLRWLPILFNPPPFRSAAPAEGRLRGTYPPHRAADLGAFAAALAHRYGPGGSFWEQHPRLPRLPVRAWQVWNEPNLTVYWPPRPDPAAYVRLLRASGRAIKRVDPKAEIVTAGMPQSRLGVPFRTFLRRMYRAGAAGSFDTLAVHAFARNSRGVVGAVEAARRVETSHGADTPVWITELGWATGGPPSAFRVSERRQAVLIRRTLAELARRRRDLRLRGVVYFNWRDSRPFAGGQDFFGLHTGLLRIDGSAKPGLAAYARDARAARR
jgi:hypothetical protein